MAGARGGTIATRDGYSVSLAWVKPNSGESVMKSLKFLLAATTAVALSGSVLAQSTRDRTQYRSDQSKDMTRDRDGKSATDQNLGDRSTRAQSRVRDDQTTTGRDRQATEGRAGLREIEKLGSARIIFYRLGPADMRMSKLIGTEIRNLQDENVGEIEDIILENGTTMRAIIVGVGGFLGLGERYVAVDPSSITISRNQDGDVEAVLNSTREDLRNAPEFRFDDRRRRVGRAD
jgi:sporulation protein YlmC with PRC-barrel domain